MDRAEPVEILSGRGFAFEDHVGTYFAAAMLADESVVGLGPPIKIEFQVKVDGWRLDDLLVWFGTCEDTCRRWAVSIKSGQPIRSVFEKDFTERAWDELLGESGSGFNPDIDLVGLVTRPLPVDTKENLEDLIAKARSQDPRDLDRRIARPRYVSRDKRKLWNSLRGPTESGRVSASPGELLKRFKYLDLDLLRSTSSSKEQAIRWCERSLPEPGEADKLWDSLFAEVQTERTNGGYLNLPKLYGRLSSKYEFLRDGHSAHNQVPSGEHTDLAGRPSLQILSDYRHRMRDSLADGVEKFVDLVVACEEGEDMDSSAVSRRIGERTPVALIGPSGYGKSFLAQHLAVRHCEDARLVVWMHADEYEKGRFDELLARSMEPFSEKRWETLLGAAEEFGVGTTFVVDGLNECPPSERGRLLQQLSGFALRHAASVLITSTTEAFPNLPKATVLRVKAPDEKTRLAILTAHGAKHPERISSQFRTPYELAIAAKCESELDENASVIELEGAYIREFARTEQLRAGLRSLASHLHSRLRTSMSKQEAISILMRPRGNHSPREVDEVLGCQLLNNDRYRVRFSHELIGRYLAAEDTVLSTDSDRSLGELLQQAPNRVLLETALTIESDPRRVWEAMKVLTHSEHVFSALIGSYGSDVAEVATQECRDVLQRATASTTEEQGHIEKASDPFFGVWITDRQWTEWERTVLATVGMGLTRGLFVGEVCELIDRTDEACLVQARRLQADGDRTPVSRVVSATFTQMSQRDGHGLPACYVVPVFERTLGRTKFTSDWRGDGLARRFAAGAGTWSWGRLYLAVLSVDERDPSDQAFFASLLQRAWKAGGYHLQLEALETARFFRRVDEPYRSEILNVVEDIEPNNWALQHAQIEVLDAFGVIESSTTVEDVQAHVRCVIVHADDIEKCKAASGILSMRFEPIVGPYFEAVEKLTREEKVRLLTMGAHGSDPSISSDLHITLDELTELIPTGNADLDDAAKSAFVPFLHGPPEDAFNPGQAAGACLAALRGWAKFETALPPEAPGLSAQQRNWRLVTSLVLAGLRHDTNVDAEETWRVLIRQPTQTILNLASLQSGSRYPLDDPKANAFERLVKDYGEPMRLLFELVLEDPDKVPAERLRRRAGDNFITRILGRVGDESTAARLRSHISHQEMGPAAVEAIRQINNRVSP